MSTFILTVDIERPEFAGINGPIELGAILGKLGNGVPWLLDTLVEGDTAELTTSSGERLGRWGMAPGDLVAAAELVLAKPGMVTDPDRRDAGERLARAVLGRYLIDLGTPVGE